MRTRNEIGAIRKPAGSGLPVALVYPNAYRVGMANLGYQFLYTRLNADPRYIAERFFIDHRVRAEAGVKAGMPRSEESGRPLADFPVIAFSLPFENDYPAVPDTLRRAGIPCDREDRSERDPVVVAGGVSISLNPEPPASFLDLIHIGELEETFEHGHGLFSVLADVMAAGSRPLKRRADLAAAFRDVPHVYVPSAYRFAWDDTGRIVDIQPRAGHPARVTAAKRRSQDGVVPVSQVFSPDAEFGDTMLVETNRGCGRGCRFCAAGWTHLPVRYARFGQWESHVDRAIEEGHAVGLVGSDLAGHPELAAILSSIVSRGGRFSLSSIRPEGLTDEIIGLLARTGQHTATLAPEVASPRLREVIAKPIPRQRFFDLIEKLVAAGIPNVRLYFMIGLPTETREDVAAIVAFVQEGLTVFTEASRAKGRIGSLGVQVNPFVPKPWTPFQWAAMASPGDLAERIALLRQGLKGVPNVSLRIEPVKEALFQGVISRGDRRLARVLSEGGVLKLKRGGQVLCLDVTTSHHHTRPEPLPDPLPGKSRARDELLPWDVVDHGVSKERLWQAYAAAMKAGLGHEHDPD